MMKKLTTRRLAVMLLALVPALLPERASAQFFIDPNTSLMLGTLRDISFKHNLALEEQRRQTAQMTQQLKQFYDNYSLLRQDLEFTQSLYQDMQAVKQLDFSNTYAISNFVMNADRLNYWFPSTASDLTRSTMSTQDLIGNAQELQRTYESFAISTKSDEIPADLAARRENALAGQEVFSQALLEYAAKSQVLAQNYDSMAVELHHQVLNSENKFTEAERTQLMLEAVKLRELSNSYYEKYLKLSQEAHTNELNMYGEKLDFMSQRFSWKTLQSQVNKASKVRYGFFDIVNTPLK